MAIRTEDLELKQVREVVAVKGAASSDQGVLLIAKDGTMTHLNSRSIFMSTYKVDIFTGEKVPAGKKG